MVLQHSVPNTNGQLSYFLPNGQYSFIVIEYELDAAAAVTLDRDNLGTVQITWNGEDIVNVDIELLNRLNNHYGGIGKFASAVGGACRCLVAIPCGLWFDSGNVYDIDDGDNVAVNLRFSDLALAGNVDSGTIRVYTVQGHGVMNYLYKLISRNVVFGGASTIADSFTVSNVANIYLKDASALITQVQIQKDDTTFFDGTYTVLNEWSDFQHNLETTDDLIALELSPSKDVRELIGRQVKYKYTSGGAGTLEQYFGYVDFTPDKAIDSRRRAQAKLSNAIVS